MKTLVIEDTCSNKRKYYYKLPQSMNTWRLCSLCEFIETESIQTADNGFLVEAADLFSHETFRQMFTRPQWSYSRPVSFFQNGKKLDMEDHIECFGNEIQIELGRDLDNCPHIDEISLTNRHLDSFRSCSSHFTELIDRLFDFDRFAITDKHNNRIDSFEQLYGQFSQLLNRHNQIRLIYRIAQLIHAAPFENFSKLLADIPFRSGIEMWQNIDLGYGGICVEKTSTLKFICDILNIEHTHVLGSRSKLPKNFNQLLADFITADGSIALEHDVCHHLLELHLTNDHILIDVTNGNIPFLFLSSTDSKFLFSAYYSARMVYNRDRLFITRVDDWAGEALITLSEYHIPELHYQYIFDQELGLHISANAYIGVVHDWGKDQSILLQNHYSYLAKKIGQPYPMFLHGNNIDSLGDRNLARLLDSSLDMLRDHSENVGYHGDYTFILQPLDGKSWSAPRLSRDFASIVNSWAIKFP